jgi:hypothetical protein
MTDATRAIVDYAEQDDAKDMRDAFYAELQNRVMAHIEDQKIQVAQNMFNKPEEITSDEEETTEQ